MTSDDVGPVKLADHRSALLEAANTGLPVPAGRLYGLPELADGGCWVDMAGASALAGIPPKTITSWLARGGPVRNPFPVPRRFLYRLFWPRDAIDAWTGRERDNRPGSPD